MTPEFVLDLIRATLKTALYLAAPLLGFGLITGLIVSLFQAVTQINEATLTFVPKILTILGALVIFSPWMLDVITTFTTEMFLQAAQWSQ